MINQAVKRNSEKFPNGYIIELTSKEVEFMRSQIVTSSKRNISKAPKAFTERGLYMLATILKSPQAINTTIAIIDTFTQFKEVTQTIYEMAKADNDTRKIEIFERSTDIITDLMDNELLLANKKLVLN